MMLPFKLKLEKCCTESRRLYLSNIADVTENKRCTRVKRGRKTLMSKNAGGVQIQLKPPTNRFLIQRNKKRHRLQ